MEASAEVKREEQPNVQSNGEAAPAEPAAEGAPGAAAVNGAVNGTGEMPSDDTIADKIREIMKGTSLEQLSIKKIREQLGDFFHVDMTAKKAWIKTTVDRVLEEMAEDDDENDDQEDGGANDETSKDEGAKKPNGKSRPKGGKGKKNRGRGETDNEKAEDEPEDDEMEGDEDQPKKKSGGKAGGKRTQKKKRAKAKADAEDEEEEEEDDGEGGKRRKLGSSRYASGSSRNKSSKGKSKKDNSMYQGRGRMMNYLSDALQNFMSPDKTARFTEQEIVDKILEYVTDNNLLIPTEKKKGGGSSGTAGEAAEGEADKAMAAEEGQGEHTDLSKALAKKGQYFKVDETLKPLFKKSKEKCFKSAILNTLKTTRAIKRYRVYGLDNLDDEDE
ncbi:unnamed protein product [Vitrella brassicaformis CCMP3155]|uniref:DEK-C domain-containing protein n=2 Tax=Vitrella brassicaformis TaxID=1169539 RepID=A0A0G4H851_VITBC|nr:unnamed protein product [Vitrella brassicaformis CCMP3155]|eukprot:CEM40072.1 unnamed protein product [Vitrella brassicaformis CCMP3155]